MRPWLLWVDNTLTIAHSLAFIRKTNINFMEGAPTGLGIFWRNQLVGMIGLNPSIGEVNLGYWLSADVQGHGIITMCTRFMTELALNELDVNRIIIRCATDNFKSRAIPERLGFTHESTARGAQRQENAYVDIEIYSFIKDDLPMSLP